MTSSLILFQRIRSTVDEKEQKQLLMDLDVVMRSSDCPYIVQFYGALFREVGMNYLRLELANEYLMGINKSVAGLNINIQLNAIH